LRLLVLGGSFNPVHIGHLVMVEEIRVEFGYDLAILVPSLRPPHKRLAEEPGPELRMEMLRLALDADESLAMDACEIERGGVSYTIDTLRDVASRYPLEGRPGLILGDDLIPGFPTWRRPEELAEAADLICAHRSCREELPLPFPHRYAHNSIVEISSSQVRERIAAGGAWRRLVPQPVFRFIVERGLYGLR